MKFLFALLATLVASGYGRDLWRSKPLPSPQIEQEWSSSVPEITKPKIQEPIFKDGGEYRYLYDGQILTGLPDIHQQYSGVRVRAIVKIQLGSKDLMQIEKVFVGSLHERFVSDPRTIIDLSAFEPMSEQDAPFEEVLKKPVRFTYENGKVDNFETTEDDPSWSINIKRSILSTFHLSLTEREEPKDEIRREYLKVPSTNKPGRKSTSDDTDDDEFFTVVEDNVAGRCEVTYVVLQVPDEDSSVYPIYQNEKDMSSRPKPNFGNVLNVTKTWDRKNCEYRPFVYNGFHLSNKCPTCESNPTDFFDLLESASHTRYNITGTKRDYIIDSAVTEAVYSFTPRSHYAGSLVAYANMTFVLIQSGPAKSPITFPEGKSNKIDGLHMIDPIFLKTEGDVVLMTTPEADQPIVQKKDYWPNIDEKPRKIKALFEKLITGMEKKEINTETAVLVQRIVGLLEKAEEDELKEIHEQIKTVSASGVQKEEVEYLFADLLVAAGSRCTFTYIKSLLVEKKLEGPVVVDVLAMLPLKMDAAKITPETLENFEQLCKNDAIKRSPFTKRSCWLAYGTLVNRACVHKTFDARVQWPLSKSGTTKPMKKTVGDNEDTTENLRCPVELRRQIVEETVSKLKSASDDETKILVIKTIGNMGLPETVDELADVAEDESVPLYIRTQAIWAMRAFDELSPRCVEVTETLLPLYRKTSNPTQLRIASFLTILATKPDLPILQDIVQSLNREVDLDVASYVYSSLSAIGNSTDPCLKNLTKDVQLALEFASPVNIDGRHSKSMKYGQYVKQMKGGLYWEVNKIADSDAPFVPRSGNFRLHATMMDKSFDLIEFGYETEGMGEALRKYAGNLTSEHIADVLAGNLPSPIRRPRDVNEPLPVQSIEEINKILNIKPKEPKEIRGSAYMKIFGQETRFVVINPTTVGRFLIDLIAQRESVIPKLTGEGLNLDNRRATLLADVKTEFPTIMGIPIRNSLSIPVVATMKGSIKANMTPKPESGFAFFKQIPTQVTVDHNVRTTIAGEIHRKLSVFLGFLRVGAGTRSRLSFTSPIDAKWELNLKDRMTKITMDMPESPVNLVKIETYPITFVWRMSRKSVTYQPKAVVPALPHTAQHWNEKPTTPEEEEMNKPHPHTPTQGRNFINMSIEVPSTEMVNPSGQVIMKTWIGLPITVPEMWEIPTPTFIKSMNTTIKIGDETTPVMFKVNIAHELPHVKAPTIRQIGDKGVLKIKLIPKDKQLTFTAYERTMYSMKSEQELLNQLKDKMTDIPVKDVSKSNPPADYNKYPKVGHSLQWTISSAAPDTWTTRGLLAIIYSMPGQYVKTIGSFESKIPAFAKKGCMSAEYRYPDRTGLWFMTPQQTLEKSVQGNVEMSWGDECGGDKMIRARIRIQKTDEQMQTEKNALYDVNGIPVAFDVASQVHEDDNLFNSLWKECEEDRQNGAFFSKDCVDLAVRYAELLKIKFDIEFKNVSPTVRKLMWQLERFVKRQYWYNTIVEDMDVKNHENKINGVIEYSADRQYVDVSYNTPHQNVKFVNIDLPFVRPHANALFPWTPARLAGLTFYPTCTLSGHKLNTFDDVSDDLPLSQCYHLMTKDAADDNLFAVLVAAAGKNTPAKKLLVMLEGHKIEIVPKDNQVPTGTVESPIDVTTKYVVKYNGQVMPEAMTNKDKPMSIPPNTPEDKEALAMIVVPMPAITGNTVPIVKIISPATGLSVLFDGSSVTVEPSPWWKNNLVGLCGTFNGQTWDDKMLPNKTVVEEPRALSRAYMIEANGCDKEVPEVYFKPSVKKL